MKRLFTLILAGTLFSACGEDSSDSSRPAVMVNFRLHNKSQYEIKHIFLQAENEEYQDKVSLISKPLAIGETFSATIPVQILRVTVTREIYSGGPLHAYTTAPALNISRSTDLEYLDDQFRLVPSE